MTTDDDDVFDRILDKSKGYEEEDLDLDAIHRRHRTSKQTNQERRKWEESCKEAMEKEDPIERYCYLIRDEVPWYEESFEDYEDGYEDHWKGRIKLTDNEIATRVFFHKKPEGMTDKEWKNEKKKRRRLNAHNVKQEEVDRRLVHKNSPYWLFWDTLKKIDCRCTGEGMRNGMICDTCKLLKKCHNDLIRLFKDAAEGRSSIA